MNQEQQGNHELLENRPIDEILIKCSKKCCVCLMHDCKYC